MHDKWTEGCIYFRIEHRYLLYLHFEIINLRDLISICYILLSQIHYLQLKENNLSLTDSMRSSGIYNCINL